jgi:hypothetical protein
VLCLPNICSSARVTRTIQQNVGDCLGILDQHRAVLAPGLAIPPLFDAYCTAASVGRSNEARRPRRRRRPRARRFRCLTNMKSSTTTPSRSPRNIRMRSSACADPFHDRQPDAVGKGRPKLAGFREGALGHRAIPHHQTCAKSVCRDVPLRGLLELVTHSQTRQRGGVSDDGGYDTTRRAAVRPGGPDRGPAARCHSAPEDSRIPACGPIRIPTPTC